MADVLDGAAVQAWIRGFTAAFRERRDELDELDRRSGDGDFATNLLSAIERTDAGLGESGDAGEAFAAVATAFMHAGGTSGPLFGVWFRAFGRAAAGGLDVAALATGAGRGAEAVAKLGGAAPGDKTMLDAMAPAAGALAAAAERGDGLATALDGAAAAAHEGVEATAAIVARRGRASYVGEVSRGVRDPGAVAVALFFEAGRDALGG